MSDRKSMNPAPDSKCSPSDRSVDPTRLIKSGGEHQDLIDRLYEVSLIPSDQTDLLSQIISSWKRKRFIQHIRMILEDAFVDRREDLATHFDEMIHVIFIPPEEDVDMSTGDEAVIDPDTLRELDGDPDDEVYISPDERNRERKIHELRAMLKVPDND